MQRWCGYVQFSITIVNTWDEMNEWRTEVWEPGKEEVKEQSDEVEWSDREVEECKSLELENRFMQYIVEQKKSVCL